MKQYISEERAIYEDSYHGQFSRKLAMWAISMMDVEDPASGETKPISRRSIDDVMEIMDSNGVLIPDECLYTAYYLYHMAIADYPKTCKTDGQRAIFVGETLNDPDGDKSDTLSCFEAKMCNAGIPIYWERYL